MAERKGRLRRTLSKWADSEEAIARERRSAPAQVGDRTIGEAQDRDLVSVRGTVKTIVLRPRGGVPALEAELDDGTGVLSLVWLGRRSIAGIDPGRSIRVRGRIGNHDGQRIIYNPRYELIP